jgi:protein involved in polysaccharide export with SLBB domain
MVVGDVKIPGKYILQKSGDKLTDILKRTEGFKASADSSSATIRRIIKSNLSVKEREAMFQRLLNVNNDSLLSNKKLRNEIYKSYELISANIAQAMRDPSAPDNLVLEDGDIITIEKNTNLVKISGDVYYPTIIPYKEKRNAKFYIKQAGNFMPSARRSGVLVIYPNGKAKSIKTFLFFKSYPTVTSRSEVFVPQKNKNNRTKITASELAVIVSALGVVANVYIAAKKL